MRGTDSEFDCDYVPCSSSLDSEVFFCFFDISQIRKISVAEIRLASVQKITELELLNEAVKIPISDRKPYSVSTLKLRSCAFCFPFLSTELFLFCLWLLFNQQLQISFCCYSEIYGNHEPLTVIPGL
jgi:hypothetical protein